MAKPTGTLNKRQQGDGGDHIIRSRGDRQKKKASNLSKVTKNWSAPLTLSVSMQNEFESQSPLTPKEHVSHAKIRADAGKKNYTVSAIAGDKSPSVG
jgi:hypothetical protein